MGIKIRHYRTSDGGSPHSAENVKLIGDERPNTIRILLRATGGLHRGSSTYLDIGHDAFEELAIEMIKVNPSAAIKAFGAALQEFECQDD